MQTEQVILKLLYGEDQEMLVDNLLNQMMIENRVIQYNKSNEYKGILYEISFPDVYAAYTLGFRHGSFTGQIHNHIT